MPNKKKNELFARLCGTWCFASAPYGLLIIGVLLSYSNVYNNEFLFDDLVLITGNSYLASWHNIGTLFVTHLGQASGLKDPFYRPLQTLIYLSVYQLAGLSTVAFHAVNVALHVLNACLLYTLGVKLEFNRTVSLLAALLWALHPVHTEAVTYMSGTADPLCAVFVLTGILTLATGFSRRRVSGACLLFWMALMSKEGAIVFPLLAMGLLF